MGNLKQCYCQRSSLFIKPGQNNKKVCRSSLRKKESFAVAEGQKITANVHQTCGFVAAVLLSFCLVTGRTQKAFQLPLSTWLVF